MPRPPQYDRDEVLERAMVQFWRDGFEGSSVQDLVEATGLQRGSLYGAFGDKRGLFLAAVERYLVEHVRRRLGLLRGEGPALARLRAFFADLVAYSCGPGRGRGCMVANTAVEMAPRDEAVGERIRAILGEMEAAFAAVVAEGRAAGEIRADCPAEAQARLLVATLMGLRVLARAGLRRAFLEAVAEGAVAGLATPRR
ncbi:TetR/AcrR family transcriptional regulator [Inmirania thermothiophila]|uniref:TetR family transcriptional regulator n=1 Tax=Inmirania thermothiophila TaxID=1750597 RepID=A0A3N1YA98_9GAMM|nr:TetR/AcrR family transcriptional regulator [Inmirania thermothiophila]ROR34552.1 TetR family transcriptional regulator [Inmirania thermothiophila]